MAVAPREGLVREDREPGNEPKGVRTALIMNTSFSMLLLLLWSCFEVVERHLFMIFNMILISVTFKVP